MRLVHFIRSFVSGVVLLLCMLLRLASTPPLIGAAVCCAIPSAGAAEQVTPKRNYHLPRGDAATTLRQFATISGSPVLFMMDKVQGEQTNAIDGEYSPGDALKLMLAGTSLEIMQEATVEGFVVGRRTASAQREVAVRAANPKPQTKNMTYQSIPAKIRAWFARAALAATTAAIAQEATMKDPKPAASDEVITLADFVVTSSKVDGYRATNSITSSGIGVAIGDTPTTIFVVTKDLLTDTRTDLINDALKFVPGVITNPTNESQPTVRGFQGQYTLRNGLFRRQNLLTFNVERIEVIQGPSSIFYSNIRPGGVINYITTKPVLGQNFVDLNVSGGGVGYERAEVALNGALGEKVAVRVDIGNLATRSFRSGFRESQKFISFAATWQITPNQILTFEAGSEKTERSASWSAYISPKTNSRYFNNPTAIASGQTLSQFMSANYPGMPLYDMYAPFGPASDPYGRESQVFTGSFARNADRPVDLTYNAKLTDHLAFNATLNYAEGWVDGLNLVLPGDILASGNWAPGAQSEYFKGQRDSWNMNTRLTYRFKFAGINNTVMVGNDNQKVRNNNYITAGLGNQRGPVVAFDMRNGVIPDALTYTASLAPLSVYRYTDTVFKGTYIVDQASLLNETLFVTAGARYTNFSQEVRFPERADLVPPPDAVAKKSTPQFGALYKLPGGISAFATYSESIQPQTQIDVSGRAVDPITAKGWDMGLKADLFGGALTGTVNYFEINQSNTAILDSAANVAHGLPAGQTVFAYYTYGNAQRVRGMQLDLNYNLGAHDQLILAYNHFFEAQNVAPQANPINIGVPLAYQPKDTLQVWNRYQVHAGALSGLILGAGFHYNSEGALGGNFNDSKFVIPGFVVWDALVGYDTKIAGRKVQLRMNIKNLTDKIYRDAGSFANPRTWMLSASTRF